MKKGDVYRHYEGQFYKVVDIRKIGQEVRVYLEGPRGTKINLTERQFKSPVKADGGSISRFRPAHNDPMNPWK